VKADSEAKGTVSNKAKAKAKAKANFSRATLPEIRRTSCGKDATRRLLRGPEVHKVISYQGQAAAEYARRIEEKQRVWMERFPHRFEASGDGAPRSVPVRLSLVGKDGDLQAGSSSIPERKRQSVDVLDRDRQAQLLLRLREDERAVASWIYAVVGDEQAQAAAKGECCLQAALQSGEAICDLVNAVWPGHIVGILRGELKPCKRLANITRFLQACSDLGVGERDLFTPSDLAEGKNIKIVVRCLFALGAMVPEPPDYDGPRLEDSMGSTTPPKDPGEQPGACSSVGQAE